MNATAPRSRSADKRFYGVLEALVTDVNDPDHLGRVKVQIPCFDDATESQWCRVGQFYAGNGYGAFWIPEPGDEVLVSFVHGDMTYPVVLCGLFNGKDKPPSQRTKQKNQKMIRTKNGHQITLDDTDGKLRIEIKDAKEANTITLDTEKKTITIEASQGKLILKGNGVEITSQADVKIQASSTMTIKGSTVNIN